MSMKPVLPSSVGDLADRVTILSLKVARLAGDGQQFAGKELAALDKAFRAAGVPQDRYLALARVNAQLWDLEDARRRHVSEHVFGAEALAVANEVTRLNDVRAGIKRQINEECGSEIVEVKSHAHA